MCLQSAMCYGIVEHKLTSLARIDSLSDSLRERPVDAKERASRGRVFTETVSFCTTPAQRAFMDDLIQQSGHLLDISSICRLAIAGLQNNSSPAQQNGTAAQISKSN